MSGCFSESITSLRAAIAEGRISAPALLDSTLAEISRRNGEIGALTDVLAGSATREAKVAAHLPPSSRLAGIPLAIKDNIDTVPAICAAGLSFLSAYRPERDAEVVRLLRKSGAVIVGVAATDSGAFGVTTPGVSNPLAAARIAGGSSGGSAAAVAAGFCKAAIGTDTGGSLRIPAACCGIVGFKPTHGRVKVEGVRPLAASVDHIGPLAASVADIKAVMEVIDPGFSRLPCPARGRSTILGVPRSFFTDASPALHGMMETLFARLTGLGLGIRDVDLPNPSEIIRSHLVLSLTEAALSHSRNSCAALDWHPEAAKQGLLLGQSYSGTEHLEALEHRRVFVREIDSVFAAVDFLILPTLPIETPERTVNEVMLAGKPLSLLETLIRYTALFDQSGHPAIAMPFKSPDLDMPLSFQLVGPRNGDKALLDFAEIVEGWAPR